MKINKKRVKELAHWAPVSGPQEPGDVTMDAPAHQVIATTFGGETRALLKDYTVFVRLLGMTQALNNPTPIARYQTPHLI